MAYRSACENEDFANAVFDQVFNEGDSSGPSIWPGSGKRLGEIWDSDLKIPEEREDLAQFMDLNSIRSKTYTGEDFEIIAALQMASNFCFALSLKYTSELRKLERDYRSEGMEVPEDDVAYLREQIEFMDEADDLISERLKELSGYEAFDVLKTAADREGGGQIYVFENGLVFEQAEEIFMVDRS